MYRQVGTTARNLCKRKDQELSPSTLVTTWFRLSELLASPGQPEHSVWGEKTKIYCSKSLNMNLSWQRWYGAVQHLWASEDCLPDGWSGLLYKWPCQKQMTNKDYEDKDFVNVNDQLKTKKNCPVSSIFLHARASCWDLTTDDICHLWDSKHYHLMMKNISLSTLGKKGKVINNDTVS